MKRRTSEWVYVFVEALLMSLAEGVVLALGWVARKLYRKWRRWRQG